jgi:signal transduction histidine kinase
MAVALRRPLKRPADEESVRETRGRRRFSILGEFLAALVSVIVISAAGTALFEEQLTKRALTEEANRLTVSRLEVAVAAYESLEKTLGLPMAFLSEQINVNGSLAPDQRIPLGGDLARTARSLQIDTLGVFDASGKHVAGTGSQLEGSEVVKQPGTSSRLVPVEGGFLRVLAVSIGIDGATLVGGLEFSEGTANLLRTTLSDEGEIILVADDRVVGSTLELSPAEVPGRNPDTGALPLKPLPVTLRGEPMLVVYQGIDPAGAPAGKGAIGVAVPDPVNSLTERLTIVRFLSTLVLTAAAVLLGWILFYTLVRPLVGLSRTATKIAEGDLGATFDAPRNNEIGRLAGALQQMTGELQGKTRRLQEASKRLLVAQQEERQRLARDLHDGMQQQLVVLAVKIKQLAASDEPPNPMQLEHLAAEAEEAAFALQDLGRGIFSTVLGDQGVPAALRTSASRLPMQVRLDVAPGLEDRRFSPEIEGTLYFVTMEAMANAQKHAPLSQLTIALREEPGEVVLEISDDGPGFNPAQGRIGAGLQNMADRVNAVGGSSNITTSPGEGVTILARIPVS